MVIITLCLATGIIVFVGMMAHNDSLRQKLRRSEMRLEHATRRVEIEADWARYWREWSLETGGGYTAFNAVKSWEDYERKSQGE